MSYEVVLTPGLLGVVPKVDLTLEKCVLPNEMTENDVAICGLAEYEKGAFRFCIQARRPPSFN